MSVIYTCRLGQGGLVTQDVRTKCHYSLFMLDRDQPCYALRLIKEWSRDDLDELQIIYSCTQTFTCSQLGC